MRIVQPYVHTLDPSVAALAAHAPGYQRVNVGYYDLAYSHLLRELWAEGKDFVIVEQDVVITDDVIPGFTWCDCMWATHPIPRHRPPHDPLYASLGCVRFHADLIAEHPDLIEVAARFSSGQPAGHWAYLDVAIDVTLRGRGYEPHVHDPPLVHLPYPTSC